MSELYKRQRSVAAKSRALVLALHRQTLEEAGERIAAAQGQLDTEISRIGVQIAGAVGAGMRISEIAQLTGLSRQKLYELRDRHMGEIDELDMRTLAQLGASGALPIARVSDQLQVANAHVEVVVRELEEKEFVKPLMSSYEGGRQETFFKLTPAGEEALERWMLDSRLEPARMSVYVAIDSSEQGALRAVAEKVFGPEWFALIEMGTMSGQQSPELAFNVVAESQAEAVAQTRDRMAELRRLAKLKPREVVITALSPAGPLHLTFGHRRSWMTEGIGED